MANVVRFSRDPSKDNQNTSAPQAPQQVVGRRRSFKRLFFLLPLAVAFVAASGLLYYWEVYLQFMVKTDNAQVDSGVMPVNSRAMGFVDRVYVNETDRVSKDTLLAELDSSDVDLELRLKEAKYRKTTADLERARKLQSNGALSLAELEMSEAAATLALVDLDGSKLKHSFTQIRAHVGGVIAKRNLQPGQFVQPGQSLFWIVPESTTVRVKANLKETQVRRVSPGQDATVEFDSIPGRVFKAKVETILPATGALFSLFPPENSSGHFTKVTQTIPIYVSVDVGPGMAIAAGMSASVEIDTRPKDVR